MVIPSANAETHLPGTPRKPTPLAARTGRIFDIKRFSSHDGPGIRSTVFLTGCPLRCAWCHNPEAFVLHDQPGANVREMTIAEVIREVEKDALYYDRSGGGVTISGGEPLFQSSFTLELLRACRERELHTALDTCGLVETSLLLEAASSADVVLYDLKMMDCECHRTWTGAPNQRILENLHALDAAKATVWIRMPLIPGANDNDANLDATIDCLAATRFRRISILPYHRIAEGKYQSLGIANRMSGIEPPSAERIDEIRHRFHTAGFDTHIGR
jgi:pyruvate formate lyase activating enzyme